MIGVAVVGTGFGCLTHVPALRNAGFDVVALVGRDPDRTAQRAELFGVPWALNDLDEVLARSDVEAVTVATPPNSHAAVVRAAAGAGKHVLCEKPLARNASEARELLVAASQAGVVHMLGTEFRFDPGQALLARVVRQGFIGVPRLATLVLHVPMLADPSSDVPAWWAGAGTGGGWLTAHGSQVIDQVRVTLGEVRRVRASAVQVIPREPAWSADDGFVLHLVMESGAAVLVQSTPSDRGPLLIETRVIGSTGTAWIEGLGSTVSVADAAGTCTIAVPDDLVVRPPAPPPSAALQTTYEQMTGHGLDLGPYTRLAEHFRAAIAGEPPPPGPLAATFADGVADMGVLDAARNSSTARQSVDVV